LHQIQQLSLAACAAALDSLYTCAYFSLDLIVSVAKKQKLAASLFSLDLIVEPMAPKKKEEEESNKCARFGERSPPFAWLSPRWLRNCKMIAHIHCYDGQDV
jgi:hypothetical protein